MPSLFDESICIMAKKPPSASSRKTSLQKTATRKLSAQTDTGSSSLTAAPSGANRMLHTNVKTAFGRKISSTQWLQRQLNDPYVAESKRHGYRSRAAFKLLQIQEKFSLLKPGQKVADLGCAPGGWTQVAVALVKPESMGGCVVGIDLKAVDPIPHATLFEGDFTDTAMQEKVREAIGGKMDVVLSDMSPNTIGHPTTDHLRIVALCEIALEFAIENLKEEGSFVIKVFKGGMDNDLLARVKQHFRIVKHAKPDASRADSAEAYLVATGFRSKENAKA
jgi:23S rRNA (uridine2552-2'-O)-methyltransferase